MYMLTDLSQHFHRAGEGCIQQVQDLLSSLGARFSARPAGHHSAGLWCWRAPSPQAPAPGSMTRHPEGAGRHPRPDIRAGLWPSNTAPWVLRPVSSRFLPAPCGLGDRVFHPGRAADL